MSTENKGEGEKKTARHRVRPSCAEEEGCANRQENEE